MAIKSNSNNTYAPASPTVLKQVGIIVKAALTSLRPQAEDFFKGTSRLERDKLLAANDSVRLLLSRFPEKDWGQDEAREVLGSAFIEEQDRKAEDRFAKAAPAPGQKVHALPHNSSNPFWQLLDLIATSIYAVDVHPLGKLLAALHPTKSDAINNEMKEAIEVIKARFPEIAWDEIDELVNDDGEDYTPEASEEVAAAVKNLVKGDKFEGDYAFNPSGGRGQFGPADEVIDAIPARLRTKVQDAIDHHDATGNAANLSITVCKHGNMEVTGGIDHSRYGGDAEAKERVKAVIEAAQKALVKGGKFEGAPSKH